MNKYLLPWWPFFFLLRMHWRGCTRSLLYDSSWAPDVAFIVSTALPQPHFPHLLYFIWHKWDKISFHQKFHLLKGKGWNLCPIWLTYLSLCGECGTFILLQQSCQLGFATISAKQSWIYLWNLFSWWTRNLIQIKQWNRFLDACSASLEVIFILQ